MGHQVVMEPLVRRRLENVPEREARPHYRRVCRHPAYVAHEGRQTFLSQQRLLDPLPFDYGQAGDHQRLIAPGDGMAGRRDDDGRRVVEPYVDRGIVDRAVRAEIKLRKHGADGRLYQLLGFVSHLHACGSGAAEILVEGRQYLVFMLALGDRGRPVDLIRQPSYLAAKLKIGVQGGPACWPAPLRPRQERGEPVSPLVEEVPGLPPHEAVPETDRRPLSRVEVNAVADVEHRRQGYSEQDPEYPHYF